MSVTSLPITCCGGWGLGSFCLVSRFVFVFVSELLVSGLVFFLVVCCVFFVVLGFGFRVQAKKGVEGHAQVCAASDMKIQDIGRSHYIFRPTRLVVKNKR